MGTMKENAMERTRAILVDITKCIGCRSCEQACKEVHGFPKDTETKLSTTALCPFSVPRYEWTKLVPYVKKCDMCAVRQENGQAPACVEACPTGASIVGWRDEMLEEAQRRVLNDRKYVKHIYGSEEAGGTSVFFISDVPFDKLGFAAPPKQPMPALSAAALGDVPTVVLVGGSFLAGIYWISERRREVALAEAREHSQEKE
jgi:formate dehydrogenase iron-sulfur subunit